MLDFAISLALEAGATLRGFFEAELDVRSKSSEIDLLTQADLASESLILDRIRERFPGHAILSEEAGESGTHDFYWVVDPLDGTVNFAHGMPHYCVSIALRRGFETIAGVVYDPERDELFWAERGAGAYLRRANGSERRLRVGSARNLQESLLATGFPYDRATNPANNLAEFNRIILRVRGVRRAGSAALDLAYVAAGRYDGYWEYRMKPWDTAAAALMVVEAGGALVTLDGGVWDPWQDTTVAANPTLLPVLVAALNGESA
ncbi:MAG TPA: inositol monophosphatase family protein [Ardenticatenaceae bacterium]|nr:inositol monophosphatase family protein [Ardenticatenaceae bacterium]